ncbi:MAG: hypothetical protein AWU57_2041, partial [Marinobacter sp. T13-3]
ILGQYNPHAVVGSVDELRQVLSL